MDDEFVECRCAGGHLTMVSKKDAPADGVLRFKSQCMECRYIMYPHLRPGSGVAPPPAPPVPAGPRPPRMGGHDREW